MARYVLFRLVQLLPVLLLASVGDLAHDLPDSR